MGVYEIYILIVQNMKKQKRLTQIKKEPTTKLSTKSQIQINTPDKNMPSEWQQYVAYQMDPQDARLAFCQNDRCQVDDGKNHHKHTMPACNDHAFCKAEELNDMRPMDMDLPRPVVTNVKSGAEKKYPQFMIDKMKEQPYGEDGGVVNGTKVVVTKQALDKWFAQMYGITKQSEYPKIKSHLPVQIQKQLGKYCKQNADEASGKKQKYRSESTSDEKSKLASEDPDEENKALKQRMTYVDANNREHGVKSGKIMRTSKVPVYPLAQKVAPITEQLEQEQKRAEELLKHQNSNLSGFQRNTYKVDISSPTLIPDEKVPRLKLPQKRNISASSFNLTKKRSALLNSAELGFLNRTDLETTDIRRHEYMKRLNEMLLEKEIKRKKQIEDEIIAKQEKGEAHASKTEITSQTTQPHDAKSSNHILSQPEISTAAGTTKNRVKSASLASRFQRSQNVLPQYRSKELNKSYQRCQSGKNTNFKNTSSSKVIPRAFNFVAGARNSTSNKDVVQGLGSSHTQGRLGPQTARTRGNVNVRDLLNSLELEDKDQDRNVRGYPGHEPLLTERNNQTNSMVGPTNSMRMSQETLSYVGRDKESLDPRRIYHAGATVSNYVTVKDDKDKFGPSFFDKEKYAQVYTSLITSAKKDIDECFSTGDSSVTRLIVPQLAKATILASQSGHSIQDQDIESFQGSLLKFKPLINKESNRKDFGINKDVEEEKKHAGTRGLHNHLFKLLKKNSQKTKSESNQRRRIQNFSQTQIRNLGSSLLADRKMLTLEEEKVVKLNKVFSPQYGTEVRQPPPAATIQNNQSEVLKAFVEKNFPEPDSEEEERQMFEDQKKRREEILSSESTDMTLNDITEVGKVTFMNKKAETSFSIVEGEARQCLRKKKLIEIINSHLDEEIPEKVTHAKFLQVDLPDYSMTDKQFLENATTMQNELFWLEKALIAKKDGLIESCVGYYLRGLRWQPCSTLLMYNLANCFKKLGKLQNAKLWFNLGVQIQPRWVDGQVGLAMTQFEMGDFKNAYSNVKQAREDSRGVAKNLAHPLIPLLYTFKEISIFTATVCKCMGNSVEAERRYKHCLAEFKKKESIVVSDILFSMMFVPLMTDKKLLIDSLIDINDYLRIMKKQQPAEEEFLLSTYTVEDENPETRHKLGRFLDWSNYKKTIEHLLSLKYFFQRFKPEQYYRYLKNSKLQSYKDENLVFCNGRIGVVLSGTILVKNHSMEDLSRPILLHKALEGDILGFMEGDDGLTGDPLTWMICYGPLTEVLWLEKDEFMALWSLQKCEIERQIVLQQFEQTKFASCLNMISRYNIVYEVFQECIFFPGEQVISINERSPLCNEFHDLYKDGISGLKKRIDQRKLESKERAAGVTQTPQGSFLRQQTGFAQNMVAGKNDKKIKSTAVTPKVESIIEDELTEDESCDSDHKDTKHELNLKKLESANNKCDRKLVDQNLPTDISMVSDSLQVKQKQRSVKSAELAVEQMFVRFEKITRADYVYRTRVREMRKSEQKEIMKAQEARRMAEEGIKKTLQGIRSLKQGRAPSLKVIRANGIPVPGSGIVRAQTAFVNPKSVNFVQQNTIDVVQHEKDLVDKQMRFEDQETVESWKAEELVFTLDFEKKLNMFKRSVHDPQIKEAIMQGGQELYIKMKIAQKVNKLLQAKFNIKLDAAPKHCTYKDCSNMSDLAEDVCQIQSTLKQVLDKVKQNIKQGEKHEDYFEAQREVYQEVVAMINNEAKKLNHRRIEQDGIHMISNGEATITPSTGNEAIRMPQIVLTSGTVFGHSVFSRQPSVNYFGDIRAYTQPLKTYKASYQDLHRILNFTELARLRKTSIEVKGFRDFLNSVAHETGISATQLGRY